MVAEPKASREAGAMRGARRLVRPKKHHRRRRFLDLDLESSRHVNTADKDLHILHLPRLRALPYRLRREKITFKIFPY